jgi:hypothetical protein
MWDWKSDPEAPWWVKLRRARLHIDEVHQRVSTLNASKPWYVDMEPAEDLDSWVFRFRIQRPIPADLCAAVGDAIANMRSALDYVAHELAVRHTGTLAPRQEMATAFPIWLFSASSPLLSVRRLGAQELNGQLRRTRNSSQTAHGRSTQCGTSTNTVGSPSLAGAVTTSSGGRAPARTLSRNGGRSSHQARPSTTTS